MNNMDARLVVVDGPTLKQVGEAMLKDANVIFKLELGPGAELSELEFRPDLMVRLKMEEGGVKNGWKVIAHHKLLGDVKFYYTDPLDIADTAFY